MTEDVAKFVTNEKALVRILGTVKISRWVLFVPLYDSKEILSHATKKTAEVIAKSLSYVDPAFQVVVLGEDSFVTEKQRLLSQSFHAISAPVSSPDASKISVWAASNSNQVGILTGKIAKMPTLADSVVRDEFCQEVMKWYIQGQDILDQLRNYPLVFERARQLKTGKESFLASTTYLSNQSPNQLLLQVLNSFHELLSKELSQVSGDTAEALAHEAIADWLLRCPLDFK